MGDTSISDYSGDDWWNVADQFIDPSTINQNQLAIEQRHKAAKLEKDLKRPAFAIPEAATAALRSAEEQAKLKKLPGHAAIEARLDATTADTIATLERMGMGGADTINGASRAYSHRQEKENELGIAGSNMYLHNQDVLRQQQGQYANWQNMAWNWDQKLPYEQKAAAIQALKGAAIQNTSAAYNSSVGGIKDFFANYESGGMAKSNSSKKQTNTGMQVADTNGSGIDNSNISGGNEQVINQTPEQKSIWQQMYN